MKVKLENVRLSFPELFNAKPFQDSAPKYSAQFLLDKVKDKAQIDMLRKAAMEVAAAKWTTGVPKGVQYCVRDGDEKDYQSHQGMMYISASNPEDHRPGVIDRQSRPIVESDGTIYGGCYVNVSIDLWAQDNKYGKRINANILAVQFVKDGDPFGAKPINAAEEFPPLDEPDNSYADKAKSQANAVFENDGDTEGVGQPEMPF